MLAICLLGAGVLAAQASAATNGQPSYCQAKHATNFLPDPLGISQHFYENNITTTPNTSDTIGVPTQAATTGSPSSPLTGSKFAAAWLEETELYQYLNNSTGGPHPNGSPGAYDNATAGLQNLPVGTVVPNAGHTGPDLPTTGQGLPYAGIFNVNSDGSLGSMIKGGLPVTIADTNYTPNTQAWQHNKIAKDPTYGQPAPTTCGGGEGLYALMNFDVSGVSGLTPGTVYAAYLLVRDTDQSGPLSNHVWYFTPPAPRNVTALGYADSYRSASGSMAGVPSPWQGSPNVIFVGCNYFSPDRCANDGLGHDLYDGGAILIQNNGATAETVAGPDTSQGPTVTVGVCSYAPWPNLNVTIPSGQTLILTQTGGQDPCGATLHQHLLDGPYNFDVSESAAQHPNDWKQCVNDGLVPQISLLINGQATSISDSRQILNKRGVDKGGGQCGGQNEFRQWTQI